MYYKSIANLIKIFYQTNKINKHQSIITEILCILNKLLNNMMQQIIIKCSWYNIIINNDK